MKYLIIYLTILGNIFAQLDTVKMDWPFPPFQSSQNINATFAEFRNTLSSDHFHNAVDIGEPDGNPCYSTLDGTVYSLERNGSNAYIRIGTKVDNKWKQLTYLHILPSPSLSVGDAVKKGETIIGTVVNGMGHVHLIERELVSNSYDLGNPINNLRKNGGLTPFVDNWAPVIERNSLKFYVNNSSQILQSNGLFGKVDIQIKIREINGSTSGETNNGTYIAGYRIWNKEKTEVLFEPDDSGVKYRFDVKPLDSYVHNAYVKNVATLSNPLYWLTNGNGADVINSTRVISDNWFDASALPKGDYQLEIFAEDTRDNKTNEFFDITIADPKPTVPIVYGLLNTNGLEGIKILWKNNPESDIAGYRLYYLSDSQTDSWNLAFDESKLTTEVNEYTASSSAEFSVPSTNMPSYFRLVAVDIAGQESDPSNVYARSAFADNSGFENVLIVNAFNKFDENDEAISHNYITSYFEGLSKTDSLLISSLSNKYFLDDKRGIQLENYKIVIWFTGDNTNHEATIQPKEMGAIAAYLSNGGNFFISGSKIGYDLDERQGAFTDTLFYYNYLKAEFAGIGYETIPPVFGIDGTVFENNSFGYGSLFEENYPDDINPKNGSELLLDYNFMRNDSTHRHAGVGYSGRFGEGTVDGRMVYISFPLESVAELNERKSFFKSLLQYFGLITKVKENTKSIPNNFELYQNYPNPFNPSTVIEYSLPGSENYKALVVRLKIYDILGREVATLVNKEQKPGSYRVKFDASHLSSGIYFYKIKYGALVKARKMLLIK